MELLLVGTALLVMILAAKNGSSKNLRKPSKEDLDDDTIYG